LSPSLCTSFSNRRPPPNIDLTLVFFAYRFSLFMAWGVGFFFCQAGSSSRSACLTFLSRHPRHRHFFRVTSSTLFFFFLPLTGLVLPLLALSHSPFSFDCLPLTTFPPPQHVFFDRDFFFLLWFFFFLALGLWPSMPRFLPGSGFFWFRGLPPVVFPFGRLGLAFFFRSLFSLCITGYVCSR